MNCSDRCGVQQERALLAGIVLVDSCLCETEKVRRIDGEERSLFAVSWRTLQDGDHHILLGSIWSPSHVWLHFDFVHPSVYNVTNWLQVVTFWIAVTRCVLVAVETLPFECPKKGSRLEEDWDYLWCQNLRLGQLLCSVFGLRSLSWKAQRDDRDRVMISSSAIEKLSALTLNFWGIATLRNSMISLAHCSLVLGRQASTRISRTSLLSKVSHFSHMSSSGSSPLRMNWSYLRELYVARTFCRRRKDTMCEIRISPCEIFCGQALLLLEKKT